MSQPSASLHDCRHQRNRASAREGPWQHQVSPADQQGKALSLVSVLSPPPPHFLLLSNFPSALSSPPSSLLDGYLVPDHSFHTSDSSVFALRRFPRRPQTAAFLNQEGFSMQAWGTVTHSILCLSHAAPHANHHLAGLAWTHRSRTAILAIGYQFVLQ